MIAVLLHTLTLHTTFPHCVGLTNSKLTPSAYHVLVKMLMCMCYVVFKQHIHKENIIYSPLLVCKRIMHSLLESECWTNGYDIMEIFITHHF
jgi:hypothetical protein